MSVSKNNGDVLKLKVNAKVKYQCTSLWFNWKTIRIYPTRKFLKNDRVASSMYSSHFRKIAARPGDNGDDDDCIGNDDYYKIFIAGHRFRYSLLEPYWKPKKSTRR